jgi:transcriptional regulator with XRE-family HTH domain
VAASNKDEDVLTSLGANIRRERTARNITQEKLAELADLNIRTVQKIESGSLNVLITTLVRIQRGLGCKWDRLLPPAR